MTGLIWNSPEILSESILQIALVTMFKNRMKKLEPAEWLNHLIKSTFWPFAIVLLVSLGAGMVLRTQCPQANRLKDFQAFCSGRK